CRRVWPDIRRQVPDARFTIYGFKATEPVRALAGCDGVTLIADLPDLRSEIARHQVVVLPFVSGGGIKNKLLEAAAMGKAIVCTAKACRGLRRDGTPPFVLPRDAAKWGREIPMLWGDPPRRDRMGAETRQWILKNHSWAAAARDAVTGLEQCLRG